MITQNSTHTPAWLTRKICSQAVHSDLGTRGVTMYFRKVGSVISSNAARLGGESSIPLHPRAAA